MCPSPQLAPMRLVSIHLVIRGPVLMAATPGEGMVHCSWRAVPVSMVTNVLCCAAPATMEWLPKLTGPALVSGAMFG